MAVVLMLANLSPGGSTAKKAFNSFLALTMIQRPSKRFHSKPDASGVEYTQVPTSPILRTSALTISRPLRAVLLFTLLVFVARSATAQGALIGGIAPPGGTVPFDNTRLNSTMLSREAELDLSPLQNPAISVSKLDLKAPAKARREYDQGLQLLNRKEFKGAVDHLMQSISIYPDFVAAHNALGSSYLSLAQNGPARDEFAKAVSLDDHLPISYLNLGCAELALKHFPAAQAAVQKASSIAPLDVQVLSALAYAQLMNHDYAATIATAQQVHGNKHKGAAIVHYYAAAAWDNKDNQKQAQLELKTLIREDPKSSAAEQARGILQKIKENPGEKTPPTVQTSTSLIKSVTTEAHVSQAQVDAEARQAEQDAKEQQQIKEAEAMCTTCEAPAVSEAGESKVANNPKPSAAGVTHSAAGWTLRNDVDEVSVFFAATDHGKAVGDLTQGDVSIRDSHQPPVSIRGFRSEAQLPLRLGLVIDTSESITGRFSFEQSAATNFIRKVVTGKDDLAFVVGFSNSVLLVQDFTGDNAQISQGISKLAPAGGTALWDAVAFAADKLAHTVEEKPVARVLVVISDGEDNSSSATLKQAIETAEHGEVIVYTVSTRDNRDTATTFYPTSPSQPTNTFTGDRALKVLAEGTGGAAFFPGSLGYLNHDLADLQQVIRSRYLVSYKPVLFKRDGQYRTIDITAQRSGHKLKVYARKGYYAQVRSTPVVESP